MTARDGGNVGLGQVVFSSGLDTSQWGFGEYLALGVAGYALVSMLYTSRKIHSTIKSASQRRSSKRRRIQELEDELREARSGKGKRRKR